MKIKKYLMLVIALFGFSFLDVKASAPNTITLKPKSSMYYYSEKNKTDYISGYNFYRKELTDGTYAYCASNITTKTPGGMTLKLASENKDMGLDYLIRNGYPNKSITGDSKKDYYVTQAAIWEYFDKTRGSNNWKNTTFNSSSTGLKKNVYTLVQGALAARNNTYSEPAINITYASDKMTINGDYFVSVPINVNLTNTTGTYNLTLKNAPKGTITKKTDNGGFQVYVPVQKGDNLGSVTVTVSATGVIKKTYIYTSNDSRYQDIIPMPYEEQKEISKEITLHYESKVTKVKISKQDITTKKELPGATLVVKDKNNKEVAKWVSTNEPHYIEGLEPGEYTLTEIIAPKGYVLSKETVKFTVKNDGSVTTAVMYNSKTTKVKISKQDITTKKELPGATLVVKDKNNKEVAKWVSTTEPHYIEGLEPGEYTLTEIIAPKGYVLSKETVKFTVKNDGSVTTAIMYNTKITKVKISKQDITTKEEVAGATLVIKDKNNKEIDKWVSTTEPHYIEGLEPGEYTLTEIIAPKGYILSKETVKFTVKADGTVTEAVMYNTKTTITKISKKDATTKEELAGATLVIKDKNNKEIDKWVSTTEPHYIEGLEPGEYTLTEIIAPDGYVLSKETITFTVKDDGSVTEAVMYNTLYDVPITDLNVSQTMIIVAVSLIILGLGMVFYRAKFSK